MKLLFWYGEKKIEFFSVDDDGSPENLKSHSALKTTDKQIDWFYFNYRNSQGPSNAILATKKLTKIWFVFQQLIRPKILFIKNHN